jgi:hypothetical protein
MDTTQYIVQSFYSAFGYLSSQQSILWPIPQYFVKCNTSIYAIQEIKTLCESFSEIGFYQSMIILININFAHI